MKNLITRIKSIFSKKDIVHYRIIEVIESDELYYLLQIKKYFFWRTTKDYTNTLNYTYDSLGNSGNLYIDRKFESRLAAREYYRKYYMKPKKTIVEEE